MRPEFCVCIRNNAHWLLKDYGNDRGKPLLYWTIDPAQAHRFTQHEAAIALAQIVKHAHPNEAVRLMDFPQNKVPDDR